MRLVTLLVSLLAACAAPPDVVDMSDVVAAPEAEPAGEGELRIAIGAMISPETTRAHYGGLLALIAAKVDRQAVFIQRRTYAEVDALVRDQAVDLAFVCAGPYATGHEELGMELLVVPVAHGEKVYHSYVIVPDDSEAASLDDLRGGRFAFTDPDSNTGHLVPRYMLAQRGESPASFFAETFFTHSHDNSIHAVARGLADGAAVDSLIWQFLDSVEPALTDRTRVIETSPPYGIPPVVVPRGLDPELVTDLREAFLTAHADPEIAPHLHTLQIDRFELGNDAMYESVREMERWLASQE